METALKTVLAKIAETYREEILDGGRHYIEVDIGRQAAEMGFEAVEGSYRHVQAVVPLRRPGRGMKVRIDGRTFVNYAKFDSGVVVPEFVARATGQPYQPFRPNDSMVLNFQ